MMNEKSEFDPSGFAISISVRRDLFLLDEVLWIHVVVINKQRKPLTFKIDNLFMVTPEYESYGIIRQHKLKFYKKAILKPLENCKKIGGFKKKNIKGINDNNTDNYWSAYLSCSDLTNKIAYNISFSGEPDDSEWTITNYEINHIIDKDRVNE